MSLEISHSRVKLAIILNQNRASSGVSERWGCFNSNLLSYNYTFAKAAGQPIEEFVQKRKELTGVCNALNLMGQTLVLRELKKFGLGRGVAVALKDTRDDRQKDNDKKQKVEQIAGDLLHASTWKDLGGEKFDLIMCRPGGGMAYLPGSQPVHLAIFQKMYQLLAPNEGLLLTEFDSTTIRSEHLLQSWVDRQNPGSKHQISFAKHFGIYVGNDVLALRKLSQSNAV